MKKVIKKFKFKFLINQVGEFLNMQKILLTNNKKNYKLKKWKKIQKK